jgi:hypothetical protein
MYLSYSIAKLVYILWVIYCIEVCWNKYIHLNILMIYFCYHIQHTQRNLNNLN